MSLETIHVHCLLSFHSAERRAAAMGAGVRMNKLVSSYSNENSDGPELTHTVQELCQQASAYVLIVDAGRLEEEGQ